MKSLLFSLLIVILYNQVEGIYVLKVIANDVTKSIHNFKQFMKMHIMNISETMKHLFHPLPHRPVHNSPHYKVTVSTTENGNIEAPEVKFYKSHKFFHLTTPILAQRHGRIMETHMVQTKDGYYLTTHRIPPKRNPRNRTVLIHHGLLGSSIDWILLGPTPYRVLPYLLSNAGYDVWLINARGNHYSQDHRNLTVTMPQFWNFTFDEMGLIDVPAVVDYMIGKGVTLPIDLVGHSMGSSVFLIFLSSMVDYRKYVRVGVLIAPMAFMTNIEGPLKKLTKVSEDVMHTMGAGEFLPDRKVPSWLAKKYCKGPMVFCDNPLLFLSGIPNYQRWSPRFTARFKDIVPAGGSIKTILHYIQLASSGNFHAFRDISKQYDLKRIETPLALISSSDDNLANVRDVQKLYYSIRNPIDHFVINGKNISHTDFLWDSAAASVVFRKVLKYLEKGLIWNAMQENEV